MWVMCGVANLKTGMYVQEHFHMQDFVATYTRLSCGRRFGWRWRRQQGAGRRRSSSLMNQLADAVDHRGDCGFPQAVAWWFGLMFLISNSVG